MNGNDESGDQTPQGLVSPEKCRSCGEWVDACPGMDSYVDLTYHTTTDYETRIYCSDDCLKEDLLE